MASISRERNGRRTVQFMSADGRRRSIRLGKVSQKTAEMIRTKVEALVGALFGHTTPDDETTKWVRDIPDALAGKLAKVGLVTSRASAVRTLGGFVDGYLESRTDFKPTTWRNCEIMARSLTAFFGRERNLRDITPGDADEFVIWLKAEGYADATMGRRLKIAKQFFRAAFRKKLIPENPFDGVKPPSQVNEKRKFFVTREMTGKLLLACPDAQWRLIVALCRYAGVRCPSELLPLTRGHVDWERSRVTIPSPKTEHLPGGESREIPLFPELRAPLEEVFDLAEPGATHLITRYRDPNQNLRTTFAKIIKRAGLTPWPKPFHNLRASRETELMEQFPAHVVCKWIGNTEAIAAKHYLVVHDEHFAQALRGGAKSGASGGERALQTQVQHTSACARADPQNGKNSKKNGAFLRSDPNPRDNVRKPPVRPEGFEPPTLGSEDRCSVQLSYGRLQTP